VFLQGDGDGRVEQFGLAGEMVVEGAETHVGGVGDLLDGHIAPALFGEQLLRGGDQGGPGAGLAPVEGRTYRRGLVGGEQ
jgi:hypothetical protein